jgi:lysophospholipase L1-like esterase
VFVALDEVTDAPTVEVKAVSHAKSAGMLVFNLFDLWNGRDKAALRIGEWDLHPNAEGYRVVAERLAELIDQHRAELRIDTPASPRPGSNLSAQK